MIGFKIQTYQICWYEPIFFRALLYNLYLPKCDY